MTAAPELATRRADLDSMEEVELLTRDFSDFEEERFSVLPDVSFSLSDMSSRIPVGGMVERKRHRSVLDPLRY